MKGIKLDVRSVGLGLVAGSLVGGLGGYILARSKARREYADRLDKAVAEVKAHYARPVIPRVEKVSDLTLVPRGGKWSEIIKSTLAEDPAHDQDPLEGLDDGSDAEESDDESLDELSERARSERGDGLSSLDPVVDARGVEEPPFPFEIPQEAFGELNDEGFQTISVTYYAGDRVLCDDKDQPIRDVQGTVGTLNPLGFGGISGDPHIRYVRNRGLEVDFEILLDARSYTETILGYGRPGKQREASPAATDK